MTESTHTNKKSPKEKKSNKATQQTRNLWEVVQDILLRTFSGGAVMLNPPQSLSQDHGEQQLHQILRQYQIKHTKRSKLMQSLTTVLGWDQGVYLKAVQPLKKKAPH